MEKKNLATEYLIKIKFSKNNKFSVTGSTYKNDSVKETPTIKQKDDDEGYDSDREFFVKFFNFRIKKKLRKKNRFQIIQMKKEV